MDAEWLSFPDDFNRPLSCVCVCVCVLWLSSLSGSVYLRGKRPWTLWIGTV